MEPIRVLQVLASLDKGGAETMIMNIYRKIDRTKIQFDFVVNEHESEYAYESEIRELGGGIYHVPRYKVLNYLAYKLAWKRLLDEHPGWRIIHGHHTSSAFIYLRVAKSSNRITIAHSHTAGCEITLKSGLKIIMRYWLRYIADYLFACSDKAAKWMFGKRSEFAKIINNAIDTQKFVYDETIRKDKRAELRLEAKFVIGHIGRFQTPKNHEFLIEIFKVLRDKNDKAVLMLIGDGELRHAIEKKVNGYGLSSSVIFTGVRSDIPELLQTMDVFVFPSLYEGLGVVVIEAQAAGLPCIVANMIPGEAYVTELIEEVSLKDSANVWADKILKYVDGYERQNTYREVKSKGYDIHETTKWLENFYININ
jgi:glycosyltransferase involved in cell wall biosynthesis